MKYPGYWGAIALSLSIVVAGPATAQTAKDYLRVPGPITLQGQDYSLVWSSSPSPTYFKQEYLPAGQNVQAYQNMFIVEAVTAPVSPAQAAGSQVEMLKQRKAADPIVNYDIVANDKTGEILLDFLMSDSSTGTLIVEWNAYRYTQLGQGTALYAISRRAYGDKAKAFIGGLKQSRPVDIKALAEMALPAIKPPQ